MCLTSFPILLFVKNRNSDKAPFTCEQSSCTFPAVPHLQNYNISVWVKDKLGEEMERYSFNISDRGQGSSLCIQHILGCVFEDIKTRTCQFKLLCGWCFHNLPTLCSEISVGVVFVLFECSLHNQCRKYTDIRYMVRVCVSISVSCCEVAESEPRGDRGHSVLEHAGKLDSYEPYLSGRYSPTRHRGGEFI